MSVIDVLSDSIKKVSLKNDEEIFNKTPISTLQEYCQKLGKTPRYDLTATEGRAHQPQFVFTCQVGDLTASGQGGSKKMAKHAAAEAVFKLLTENLAPEEVTNDCKNQQLVLPSPVLKSDETNPVGYLQELVVSRGWRLPEYELANENGPAHKKEFVLCCKVENMKQYGTGSAKKHAKRLAALNMLKYIVNLPSDAKENVTTSSREAINKFRFHALYNTASEKFSLDDIIYEGEDDPRLQLDFIAKQKCFEVSYLNCSHKTRSGLHQCMLYLDLDPPIILSGQGHSMKLANINGAKNALVYLSA